MHVTHLAAFSTPDRQSGAGAAFKVAQVAPLPSFPKIERHACSTVKRFCGCWRRGAVRTSEDEFQAVVEKAASVAVVVEVYRKLKR